MSNPRPLSVLIAALGGEGGGVLTEWIITAAEESGLPAQSTSIPGVAQRTGMTTYYIEIFPQPVAEGGARPVLALYPAPASIDLMVASELLEAGRAMESGYVSPDRTTLIASTHRIFSIAEKSAMADGRYDTDNIMAAAEALAQRPILDDLAAIARGEGSPINAVMLGVIAASGVLPISVERFGAAIEAGGIAVETNLRGFEAGRALLSAPEKLAPPAPSTAETMDVAAGLAESCATLPVEVRELAQRGAARLVEYQDERHATEYLGRVRRIVIHDLPQQGYRLTREVARQLALWMSYEDVIRVADLKTRPERFAEIRREVGAKEGEPVRVTEFLKPGPGEIAAILWPRWGRSLLRWTDNYGGAARWQRSLRVRTDRVGGFLTQWLLARLRRYRRSTLRFAEEEQAIENWLSMIEAAVAMDYDLAVEIAECAGLLKGYGDTHRRGRENYAVIMDRIVRPALTTGVTPDTAATIATARKAALADPDGFELNKCLPTATVTDNDGAKSGSLEDAAPPIRHQGGEAA